MARAMIISLGGSKEPIIATIKEHRPEFICFFASNQSVEELGEIKKELKKENILFRNFNVITDDPQNLIASYQKALECTQRIEREGYQKDDVVVDYTGGTKSMTGALTLATISKGYNFAYVGGKERNKNGLGTVLTGQEEIYKIVNPWQIFAIDEKQRIKIFFNQYHFVPARQMLLDTMPRLNFKERLLFESLSILADGYSFWEKFNHSSAKEKIKDGLEKCKTAIAVAYNKSSTLWNMFIKTAESNYNFIYRIAQETKGFKELNLIIAIDLVSDAERRAEESMFDDAVVRLYRALEMLGQIGFKELHGVDNDSIPLEKIPSQLQDEYKKHLDKKKNVCKLPLDATFRVLEIHEHPFGIIYKENRESIRELQHARNYSRLVHSIHPVKEKTYKEMLALLQDKFGLTEKVQFPKIPEEW